MMTKQEKIKAGLLPTREEALKEKITRTRAQIQILLDELDKDKKELEAKLA